MNRLFVLLCALALVSLAAPARSATSVAAPDSSHLQAVREFCDVVGIERQMTSGADVMIDAQVKANPAIAPYRDVLVEWSHKYLTWEAIGPEITKLYLEAFSEPEMREITAFYRTPTGQKSLTLLPQLMQKGAAIGSALGQRHTPELLQMIKEKDAKSGQTETRM